MIGSCPQSREGVSTAAWTSGDRDHWSHLRCCLKQLKKKKWPFYVLSKFMWPRYDTKYTSNERKGGWIWLIKTEDFYALRKWKHGAPGWLSRLSVWLWLRSWSHGLWVRAPHWALCWQLRAWSLLQILCLPLSLPLPHSCSVFLSLSHTHTHTHTH